MGFKTPGFLYETVDIAIWSDVEQGLTITAGSLATLRPLYRALTERLEWSQGTTSPLGKPSERKDSREWYGSASDAKLKKNSPFSFATLTRKEDGITRLSSESNDELARNEVIPVPIQLRNNLVNAKLQDQGFNSWRIQIGGNSDENLTVAQGITKHTDVSLESQYRRN